METENNGEAEQSIVQEIVTVEVVQTPSGFPTVNLQGAGLRMSAPGQEWERIIQVLQAGLRAATLQAAGVSQEPARILSANGFLLPTHGRH